MHTIVWLENLKEREHLEGVGVDEKIILERILWKLVGRCSGFVLLRIGASGELL
jgi:hypothetical protein